MDIRDQLRNLPNHSSTYLPWLNSPKQYPIYSELLKIIEPSSIFEVGTCMGYFLCTALLSLPKLKEIYWVDNESYVPNSNQMAIENMKSISGNREITFDYWKNLTDSNVYFHDLIHIDGDHTYEGCKKDLEFVLNMQPKLIIGHDYSLKEYGVKQAVNEVCKYFYLLDEFQHGLYIIGDQEVINKIESKFKLTRVKNG